MSTPQEINKKQLEEIKNAYSADINLDYADGTKELKEIRASLQLQLEDLHAQTENFTSADQKQFDKIANKIEEIDNRFANKEAALAADGIQIDYLKNMKGPKNKSTSPMNNTRNNLGATGFGQTRQTRWRDKKGNPLNVVGPNQSFTNQTPDVGIGELAAGMLTGQGRPEVKNALAEGTDSAGGFTVPRATLSDFYDKMRAKSRIIESGAKTIELETDETTVSRVVNDPEIIWHQENFEEDDSDITFEGAVFKPKTLMILVRASREMVADSVNINEIMESVFSGSVGAAVDHGILFGTETDGEMKGLTQYGIPSIMLGEDNGGPLTSYDPLVTIYRMMLDGNSDAPTSYLMAPREWETLATLKDDNSRYLDRPQALEGIPFLETTNMPVDDTIGTSENAGRIVAGNWADLMIGLRSEMRIELLRERFAQSYQFGFLVHMRVDALPAHNNSFAQVTGITP